METMSNPFGADDGGVNPFVSRDNYGVVKEFEGAGVIRQGTHARCDTTYAARDEVTADTATNLDDAVRGLRDNTAKEIL